VAPPKYSSGSLESEHLDRRYLFRSATDGPTEASGAPLHVLTAAPLGCLPSLKK